MSIFTHNNYENSKKNVKLCCDFHKCKRKLILTKCTCDYRFCVLHISPGFHNCPRIFEKKNEPINIPIAHGKFPKINPI
jgi:predicted nucleic acid binding AN1-type Zn finger protein